MVGQTARVIDIQGYNPAVDLTRTDKQGIVEGENYLFDVHGPRAYFGGRFLNQVPLTDFEHIQGFDVEIDNGALTFTVTNRAILTWDEALGTWRELYRIPDTSATPYRWTYGYLNGFVFMAHPRVGMLDYSLATGFMQRTRGPGIPEAVIACAVDNGRLGALTKIGLYWSKQSDGHNFTPELGGAGVQIVNDRTPGIPITVISNGRGFITWTTGGVMFSKFVGDVAVFKHANVATEYRPVNSFCILRRTDKSVVILDERGLFETDGESFKPAAPLFNEFLSDYILRNKLREGQNLRIEWDNLRRHIYVLTSTTYASSEYERTFVLYAPLDKWGELNHPVMGVFPVTITGTQRSDRYWARCETNGLITLQMETGSREGENTRVDVNLVEKARARQFEEPEAANGSLTLGASCVISSLSLAGVTGVAGFYVNASATPVVPELIPLNSMVRIGMFRGIVDTVPDMLTEVIQLTIRSGPTGPFSNAYGNYTLDAPEGFDLSDVSAPIDNEFEGLNYVNHKLRVISTMDGENEFMSVLPRLVEYSPAVRFYTCSTVGLWHIIEFKADEVGEGFKVMTTEVGAIAAGSLT